MVKKVMGYINSKGEFVPGDPAVNAAVEFHNRVFNNKIQKSMKTYKIEDLDASRKTEYRKGQNLTKEEVIALFKEISSDAANNKYYVGITCNPEEREDAHNANFLAVVDCPDMEAAKDFEKTAAEYNFDAGKVQANVHKPESKKVYIYKKTPKTKE